MLSSDTNLLRPDHIHPPKAPHKRNLARMIVPKKVSATLLLLVVTICLFLFSRAFGQWLSAIFVKSGPYIPYTTHIVLFQFKADISLIAIKDVRRLPEITGLIY